MSPKALRERVAELIADGSAIDWETLQSDAQNSVERSAVQALNLTAKVVDFHRRAPESPHPNAVVDTPEARSAPAVAPRARRTEITVPMQWGPLSIIEKVGSGAFGDVYRGRDVHLGQDVAIKFPKVSDPNAIESLTFEAQALGRLQHPNIAKIYGIEQFDGILGYWMELIDGVTLDELLRQGRLFSEHEAATIAIEVCRALSKIHEIGLVHLDVKPSNIMRDSNNRIVLMDFGTVRSSDARWRRIAGTVPYAAPEAINQRLVTAQADVYSLGITIFRLITNAFPADSTAGTDALADSGLVKSLPLATVVSDSLRSVLKRALAPSPNDRYQTARSLKAALMECSAALSRSAYKASSVSPDSTTAVLLDEARRGNSEALELLFQRYLPSLRRWARGRLPQWTRDLRDTDDLVQETVTQSIIQLDTFEPRHRGALQAYLRQALINRVRDEINRVSRRPPVQAIGDGAPVDTGQSPLDEAIGREALERYEAAISRLRKEERELLIARVELGQSYAQIAANHHKSSADAARMAVSRALVRLAEEMDLATSSASGPTPRYKPDSTQARSREEPKLGTLTISSKDDSSREWRAFRDALSERAWLLDRALTKLVTVSTTIAAGSLGEVESSLETAALSFDLTPYCSRHFESNEVVFIVHYPQGIVRSIAASLVSTRSKITVTISDPFSLIDPDLASEASDLAHLTLTMNLVGIEVPRSA